MKAGFLILDFGSQYTWLIARVFRELGYFAEVLAYNESLKSIRSKSPLGIVLSGGPNSVLKKSSPTRPLEELLEIAPLLGICYGMQLIALQKGGKLTSSSKKTYGFNLINWKQPLIPKLKTQKVWMSHGDSIISLPPKAQLLAQDKKSLITAFSMDKLLALQFHPEVSHTEKGSQLIQYFASKMCQAPPGTWSPRNINDSLIKKIQKQVPKSEKVFCALSGGVDSTVTAVLLSKALGPSALQCVFVDTGLLRKSEYEEVLNNYSSLKLNIRAIKARSLFFEALKSVSDPEQKRKIIGSLFISLFKKEMQACQYLAQGTLYPDVIESLSPNLSTGKVAVSIKSHHNVGGLPKNMNLKLIEPLRELFKDEVRQIGAKLGIPSPLLHRHPFPGPGLAIRCLGAVTPEKIHRLQQADAIFIEELKKQNWYDKVWQAFCVLLPLKTVGVQGDSRTYQQMISLRAVSSRDGMTADWVPLPSELLQTVSCRIVNEVPGINRVLYDITSKPPGTIEWE